MIRELCYSHILSMNGGFLHTRGSGVYTSFLDTDELKVASRAPKVSGAFEKQAPGL